MTRTRIGLVPGLLLVLAVAVAACDGGGGKRGGVASLGADKPTATTAAGGSSDPIQADLAYARCMRQHGINLPDPKLDANGHTTWELPRGVSPDAPKFKAARQACRQYRETAARPNGPARSSSRRWWRSPGACAGTASTCPTRSRTAASTCTASTATS
jgi:hypothetical protein